jgi:hypothetical protein
MRSDTGRSEFDSALADLERVKAIDGAFDVENEIARIKIARLNVSLSTTFLGMHIYGVCTLSLINHADFLPVFSHKALRSEKSLARKAMSSSS